jgi:decaprenyl-phosphate phosphoribosyltransferase
VRAIKGVGPYFSLLRADRWYKNLFLLVGVLTARVAAAGPPRLDWTLILIGLLDLCIMASGSYVLNEILDAPFDRFHPRKSGRPVPSGLVEIKRAYLEWALLTALALGIARLISPSFFACMVVFWISSLAYNCPPVRLKDIPYFDALIESFNSPLRFSLGYLVVRPGALPPLSALLMTWSFFGLFMLLKRRHELREIGDRAAAIRYRRSLRYYNQRRLFTASAVCLAVFVFETVLLFKQL